MVKSGGLGDRLFISGYDLSGDVASISQLQGGSALLDVTAINASAHERIGGLRDGSIDFATFFNDAAGKQHLVLRALPATDVDALYCRGTAIGNAAIALRGKQADYKASRGADGSMGFTAQLLANAYGIEMGEQLTAGLRTDTAATNGASLDGAAATALGLTAYLQVTEFTGTDVTVKLQDSADDISFADITGAGFAQITSGPQVQRIQTSLTEAVRRYVRVVTVTTGGVTSVSFAVMFVRHKVAISY